MKDSEPKLRVDRWLWCTRFYKTRGGAATAVRGGHVRVNGERVKPSRLVAVGDQVLVTKGPYQFDVEVLEIPSRRGPAPEARACYRESADSLKRREERAAALSLERAARRRPEGRPDKRTRRLVRARQRGE